MPSYTKLSYSTVMLELLTMFEVALGSFFVDSFVGNWGISLERFFFRTHNYNSTLSQWFISLFLTDFKNLVKPKSKLGQFNTH